MRGDASSIHTGGGDAALRDLYKIEPPTWRPTQWAASLEREEHMEESSIFSKTYDLLEWLLPATLKFPREQRFVLAKRVQDAALNFYEAITAASLSQNPARYLEQADIELQRLRLYLRLSHDLKFINMGQYEHVAKMVVEIGKLLGGWRKKYLGQVASKAPAKPVAAPLPTKTP